MNVQYKNKHLIFWGFQIISRKTDLVLGKSVSKGNLPKEDTSKLIPERWVRSSWAKRSINKYFIYPYSIFAFKKKKKYLNREHSLSFTHWKYGTVKINNLEGRVEFVSRLYHFLDVVPHLNQPLQTSLYSSVKPCFTGCCEDEIKLIIYISAFYKL